EINNNSNEIGFAEIALKDEENIRLDEIIDKNGNILYIKCIDWNYLNNSCKLDYGRTMTFDGINNATKRAFQMKNCELTEIGTEGFKKEVVEFKTCEDWMMKRNLFFSVDADVMNFVK